MTVIVWRVTEKIIFMMFQEFLNQCRFIEASVSVTFLFFEYADSCRENGSKDGEGHAIMKVINESFLCRF